METVSLVYYSPTGTTQKICRAIGQHLGLTLISEINITNIKTEFPTEINKNCLTIIGVPVYAGRLPIPAMESLKKLQANQSPVVIVVVYGNREYDDSLLELKEIAESCGFKIIAGAAFIGEHSFSTAEKPIAKNRPDAQDLKKCKDFALVITKKLKNNKDILHLPAPLIPGNLPYRAYQEKATTIVPETDYMLCTFCKTCMDVCPVNAISVDDMVITDGELCTLCCACVKYCPDNARKLNHPAINATRDKLFLNFSTRKEATFFV